MKNKDLIILSFVLSFPFFISCNQKKEIKYYDAGEIRKITKRINEHETHFSLAQIQGIQPLIHIY